MTLGEHGLTRLYLVLSGLWSIGLGAVILFTDWLRPMVHLLFGGILLALIYQLWRARDRWVIEVTPEKLEITNALGHRVIRPSSEFDSITTALSGDRIGRYYYQDYYFILTDGSAYTFEGPDGAALDSPTFDILTATTERLTNRVKAITTITPSQ